MTKRHGMLLAAATAVLLMGAASALAAEINLKMAAPPEAHMVVYGRHNPERDGERQYWEDAWKTWNDERINERFLEIVTSTIPADKLATAKGVIDEVKTALGPINCQAFADAPEAVYAQEFEGPFNQHVLAVRLTADDASGFEQGVVNLFKLLSDKSGGKVPVVVTQVGSTSVTTLGLPPQAPMQPSIGHLGDVVVFSSSATLAKTALERMQSGTGASKFDDPRFVASLKQLPEGEDAITFFDGQQMFGKLHDIGGFVREQVAKEHPNDADAAKKAERFAGLFDRLIDECSIIDYITTVEYTEDGHHRTKTLGKLSEGFESKILGKVLGQGKPFQDWDKWVPADATAYSLNTGVNLHALYEGIMKIVQEEFPESKEGLAKFEAKQTEIGVHIDQDILQSFSGEMISVTVPVKAADGSTKKETVSAMRCTNPEKIRELLNRAFAGLAKVPAVQAQQLALTDCAGLEGFQEIHAAFLQMFGATPVIGFRDEWMMSSSSRAAVEKVLAVREGKADSINHATSFDKMKLDPKGPVNAVSYCDVGQGVRDGADMLEKVGAMAPMFIGMASGGKAKPEDLKPVMDAVGLLPSIAKVVRKFDYFEHKLSVTRVGAEPGTFVIETVQELRKPSAN